MRRALLLILFIATGCGRDDQAPDAESTRRNALVPASPPPAARAVPPSRQDREETDGAATVLRRYYDHIEAGEYREAWAMRSASEEGLDRFQRNFAAYDRYQVTLGHPRGAVAAKGWSYVEVPIQILGTLKGGMGFGSVGSITMRRATSAAAEARQRQWHIYTG